MRVTSVSIIGLVLGSLHLHFNISYIHSSPWPWN